MLLCDGSYWIHSALHDRDPPWIVKVLVLTYHLLSYFKRFLPMQVQCELFIIYCIQLVHAIISREGSSQKLQTPGCSFLTDRVTVFTVRTHYRWSACLNIECTIIKSN